MTDRDRLIELFEAIEKDPAITCPAYKTDKTCKDCKYTINESMCNHIERKVDYLLANRVIVSHCRCKDCTYLRESDTTNKMFCTYHDCEFETFPNNYCSNGIGMVKGA